jgi:hypothetical protein
LALNIENVRKNIKSVIISGKSSNCVSDWSEIVKCENDYFNELKKCSNLIINQNEGRDIFKDNSDFNFLDSN